MRILQLIDSLRPGGAERMAISYANALSRSGASFLCCTRLEGSLKKELLPEVDYLFLRKQARLDLLAFLKLRAFIKSRKIELLQAHGSSYFMAVLVKKTLPDLKLIWHDHYGEALESRERAVLREASRSFDGIISASLGLELWARQHLYPTRVLMLKNFLPARLPANGKERIGLHGTGFKVVCVANLRPQKDHLTLLKAFELLFLKQTEISLHLIGRIENDTYASEIRNCIRGIGQNKVFLYGEKTEVSELLRHADLGILSSSSEGLPLALLEYGRAGLSVVCTAVGECPEVIQETGILVPPGNPEALAGAVQFYVKRKEIRKRHAREFQERVLAEFSEEAVMGEALEFFRSIASPQKRSKTEVEE